MEGRVGHCDCGPCSMSLPGRAGSVSLLEVVRLGCPGKEGLSPGGGSRKAGPVFTTLSSGCCASHSSLWTLLSGKVDQLAMLEVGLSGQAGEGSRQ